MIRMGETVNKAEISLDKTKIQRHNAEPTGLELRLMNWEGSFEIELVVQGHGSDKIRTYSFSNVGSPGELEAYHNEPYGNGYNGYSEIYNRLSEKCRELATAEYQHLLKVLETGQYQLHLYSNGKICLVCKDQIQEA